MKKLFPNVAASLLFVAPVILAQAPVGAAQGYAGPDAVATNLVNTVCASCNTLDRVKNKVGDKDAWTATVNRMKEKGAGLNDEQVPLVIEYLTRAAGTLIVAAAGGGRGGRGGGGADHRKRRYDSRVFHTSYLRQRRRPRHRERQGQRQRLGRLCPEVPERQAQGSSGRLRTEQPKP